MSNTAVPIELPVIDISNPHDPAVGKAMLDAAAKYGFLYVNSKGTDFTAQDVDHAFGLVRASLTFLPPVFQKLRVLVLGCSEST